MGVLWDGIEELIGDLAMLPATMTNSSDAILNKHATDAAAEIVAAYPMGPTGNLKAGVKVRQRNMGMKVHKTVTNRAPHAWLYEHGSQTRQSASGAATPLPPHPTFIPIAIRHRRAAEAEIKAALEKQGARVRESG